MNRDLIVFGEDWGGLPSSTQHLIRNLSMTRKIVWVNSIGLRRPNFKLADIKRIWNKLFSHNTPAQTIKTQVPNNDFHIVYPRTLPAPRSWFGRWLAVKLLVSQIQPVAKKAGIQSPILWTSLPTAVDLVGKLNESAVVYYCGDDFSALAGVDHDTVQKRETELIEKSDLILCASENIERKFPSTRTKLLPHGVNYELFSTPMPRANDLPNDGRPIAGFYGSISNWLDIDMLEETIKQLPNWHFVFIGKSVVDISALAALSNVLLLGERPHHVLPSYSQHWTASLLPFVDNAQIRACNPLKLSEYLAAGRPIVSTAFPAVEAFRGLVQIANDTESMVEALINSQHVASLTVFPYALRNTVSKNSWAARAQQTSHWLNSL